MLTFYINNLLIITRKKKKTICCDMQGLNIYRCRLDDKNIPNKIKRYTKKRIKTGRN